MGVFVRGNSVWFRFKLQGKVERRPSGFKTLPDGSIPKEAEAVFAELEKRLGAGLSVDDVDLGIPTVRSYGARWLKEREDRGVGTVDQERAKLEKWVFPVLGMTPLKDVRPKMLQAFVRALKAKTSRTGKPLAARTVRNIWGVLSLLLKDAVADELKRVQAGTDQTEEGHWVHYAEPGTPDLMGWVTVRRTLADGRPWAFARMVGLEVKSAKGRLRDEQVLWGRDCIEGGGYWAVVRSAEEAVAAVRRAALFETPALPPLPAPKPKAKPGKDWAALEEGIARSKAEGQP